MKNKYKCKHCNNEDVIEFIGFAPLYYTKCSKCWMQSTLHEENVNDEAEFEYIFRSKKDRMKSKNWKFNPMMKFIHYVIKKVK